MELFSCRLLLVVLVCALLYWLIKVTFTEQRYELVCLSLAQNLTYLQETDGALITPYSMKSVGDNLCFICNLTQILNTNIFPEVQ
jgi:hypothetical protein